MNAINEPDNKKWGTGLKREAENELPSFSPMLHDRVMRKVTQRGSAATKEGHANCFGSRVTEPRITRILRMTRIFEEVFQKKPLKNLCALPGNRRIVAQDTVGTSSNRQTSRVWIFPLTRNWGLATAAAIVVAGGFFLWSYLPSTHIPVRKQTTPAINVSSLVPDPGLMIDQTATQWARQFSAQRYTGLQIQARQLTDYVVKKVTLSDLL